VIDAAIRCELSTLRVDDPMARVAAEPTWAFMPPCPDSLPPLGVFWDLCKGACRPDFRGISLYREQQTASNNLQTTQIIEITNGPQFATGYSLPEAELDACGPHRFLAQAVAESERSELSNWVCKEGCPYEETCNDEPGQSHRFLPGLGSKGGGEF
jgi:hypothetical protein